MPRWKIVRRGVIARPVVAARAVAAAITLVASALGVSSPAVAQTQPFADTSRDAYYSDAVGALAGNGVFVGTECVEGMLCPGEPIDRKTMAVWTVRALDGQDPAQIPNSRFSDVAADSFHGPFIERMAELGVTGGCGDGTGFCPDGTVTRDQMAVFLTRAFDLGPGPDPGFSDVAADAWYYDQVAALAASGITAGCGDGTTFCPRRQTTRAQMATFLARATGLIELPTTTQTPATSGFKAVTAGKNHSCAIATDDTITCWGANWEGEVDAPAGTYKTVTAGAYHNCAIATDDTITCWGRNWYGQADAPAGTYKTVTAGGHFPNDPVAEGHTCAIATDDTITCWGTSRDGQADAPAGTYKTVTAGTSHNCAIATDDTITCWGRNWDGQADAPAGTFKTVTAGNVHSCAIATDDNITCWGQNRDGQADAPVGTYKTVTASGGGDPWEALHNCAMRTDDTITCWGQNDHGQADAPAGAFKTVTVGTHHSCAIATDDTITCWGRNDYGQADAPAGT